MATGIAIWRLFDYCWETIEGELCSLEYIIGAATNVSPLWHLPNKPLAFSVHLYKASAAFLFSPPVYEFMDCDLIHSLCNDLEK